MTSSNRPKTSCATCGKTAGTFTCRGCSKSYCLQHTNEHRNNLEEQMNEIIANHDRLKQHTSDKKIERSHQILSEQIDQWEQQSIEKIHQTANDIRQELILIKRGHQDIIKEKLTRLTQQLNKAKYDGDFFENDLKQWENMLYKLQHLIKQQNIEIYKEKSTIPFISKIYLTEKTNHNQVEYHSNMDMQGEYSSGNHLLRFILQHYQSNSQILIGIISKNTPIEADPYNNPTFYGWANNDLVYLHGTCHSNYDNYRSNIEKDDIFQLILDCNQQMIRLTNERTSHTYELEIDITKCPLPWQPHVRLFNDFE